MSEPNGRAWRWRTAGAGDLPFIDDGERACIREHEPAHEAAWLGAVERNRRLWSANLERTVVTLHVLPGHRRHGLGAALLEAVVHDVRRNGHDVLALGVHRANPARHLYGSAGFTPPGEDGDYLLFRRSLVS